MIFDFKEVLLRFLKHLSVTTSANILANCPPEQVISYEQEVETDGYCETCYTEETVVNIAYFTGSGTRYVYTYRGSFSSLIKKLEELGDIEIL